MAELFLAVGWMGLHIMFSRSSPEEVAVSSRNEDRDGEMRGRQIFKRVPSFGQRHPNSKLSNPDMDTDTTQNLSIPILWHFVDQTVTYGTTRDILNSPQHPVDVIDEPERHVQVSSPGEGQTSPKRPRTATASFHSPQEKICGSTMCNKS